MLGLSLDYGKISLQSTNIGFEALKIGLEALKCRGIPQAKPTSKPPPALSRYQPQTINLVSRN